MATMTATATNTWRRYQAGLAAKTSVVPRWEAIAFASAMLVALAHFVDATSVHWQHGASAPERAFQAALAFAIPVGAALAYPYLRCGWRVAVALVFAVAAITTGAVIHVVGAIKNGAGSGDYSGFAWLGAGLVLLVLALVVLVRSLPGWRWRIAAVPVGALIVMWGLFPLGIAVYATHAPRYVITDVDLGRPYEDVSFETSDGLTIRGWYVPSQNGAAVMVVHGSGGARIRPVDHARMLVRHGYGVLLFDARGHGESDGDTNAYGWGTGRDVEAAAAYLAARPDVVDGRVGALGVSMGAESALEGASSGDALRAVVSDGAGVRSINELRSLPLTWSRALSMPSYAAVNGAITLLEGTPPPPALEDRVRRIQAPTLLISSKVAEEQQINRIWRDKMTAPVVLWELPDTGHTAGLRTHPDEYESRVISFLDTHLR